MGLFRKLFGSASSGNGGRETASDDGSPRPANEKHYTERIEHVKQLKREGRQQDVIDLCSEALDAIEAEYKADGLAVAPWWYEQVALAARRSKQPDVERAAMNRYLNHDGAEHPEYIEKFRRFLAKLDVDNQA